MVEKLRYDNDDIPPLGSTLLYAVQWLLIVLPLVTVTANLMASFLGMDAAQGTALLQRLLLTVGLITAVQCLMGHRYPLIDGPSAALLLSVAALSGGGLAEIGGGMIAGGFILTALGGFGLVGRVQWLFTDKVVGVVLLLIATTFLPFLYPMVLGMDAANPNGSLSALLIGHVVIVVIVLLSYWGRGMLQNLSLLFGIAVGCLVFWITGGIDLAAVSVQPLVGIPSPLLGPLPVFTPAAVISFSLAYIAVLVNGIGSFVSVAEVVGREGLGRRMERGVMMTGLAGLLSALLGSLGTVSYSQSPGVILVSKVGSRFPVLVCGLMLALLAFLQKLTAFLSAIPDPVVGGALLVTLSAMVGVGVSVVTRKGGLADIRDYLVVGLPLLLGTAASMLPNGTLTIFPPAIRALVSNGLIVGIVIVLLLEQVVLKERV